MKITNKLYQSGTWLITVYHQHVIIKTVGCKVLELHLPQKLCLWKNMLCIFSDLSHISYR